MKRSFLTSVLTLLVGVLFAQQPVKVNVAEGVLCLLYTSPSPRD